MPIPNPNFLNILPIIISNVSHNPRYQNLNNRLRLDQPNHQSVPSQASHSPHRVRWQLLHRAKGCMLSQNVRTRSIMQVKHLLSRRIEFNNRVPEEVKATISNELDEWEHQV